MLLGAAIAAFIFLEIFVIPTVRIFPQRIGEHAEILQNPVTKAEFYQVSSKLVQENKGLRDALSCADSTIGTGTGYLPPNECELKISWFNFEMMKREIPYSMDGDYFFQIEYDGKYYWITQA